MVLAAPKAGLLWFEPNSPPPVFEPNPPACEVVLLLLVAPKPPKPPEEVALLLLALFPNNPPPVVVAVPPKAGFDAPKAEELLVEPKPRSSVSECRHSDSQLCEPPVDPKPELLVVLAPNKPPPALLFALAPKPEFVDEPKPRAL